MLQLIKTLEGLGVINITTVSDFTFKMAANSEQEFVLSFIASLMEFSNCWTSKQEATLASSAVQARKIQKCKQARHAVSVIQKATRGAKPTKKDISRPELELEWTHHHHHVEWTSWPSGSHPIITFFVDVLEIQTNHLIITRIHYNTILYKRKTVSMTQSNDCHDFIIIL